MELSILARSIAAQNNQKTHQASNGVWFMSSKIFVGGLSWGTDDNGLHEAFSAYGQVTDAKVITDRETGRSRGFGFVTYASAEEAQSAIDAMNGSELDGRTLNVNIAQERERSGGGGFRGGDRGSRGGGGRW